MPELPNLLRQRLAATEAGETQAHPDADSLTAYMEQALPVAERKAVVAHLSVCESCREVVALSQAVMAEPGTQTVLTPAPVPRWRRLFTPVFGTAASLAAMAVIAFMVLQLPKKDLQQPSSHPSDRAASSPATQEPQQAKAAAPADQTAPAEAKAATPIRDAKEPSASSRLTASAKPAEINLENSASKIAEKRRSAAATTTTAPAALPASTPVLTAALPRKDYVNTDFFNASSSDKVALENSNNLPAAPAPQPGTTNGAFNTANNKIVVFADLPTNPTGKSTVRLLTPPPPAEHPGCTVCKFMQSTAHTLGLHSPVRTPALRAGALSSSALGGPGMFSGAIEKSQPSEVSAAPAIADSDSFAASSSLSAGALAYRSADSAIPTWKVAGGKLMKSSGPSQWENAYPITGSAMEFSFVNARGNDVWAGGSHAALIHSRDGGQTWETIALGDKASGTVTSIIAGTMSVQVKTSDNQTWSSTDGGKTWTQN